ncbi:MAG: acyl-CoA/acyl-ACP dehydrogenase [Desulfobacterales bacterium]|nr:acyl-CoA/acyl-ACP dehydrogenase [Desulfobacterales bacterium]
MKPDFDNPDLFSFDDCFASLLHLGTIKKHSINTARKDFDKTREFAQKKLRPLVLANDLKMQKDPEAISKDILDLVVKERMLSSYIPKFLGGTGSGSMWSMNLGVEEMASVEPAFQHGVLAGHGLGFAALGMTLNLELIEWVVDQIIENELKGKPFLLDCAITEPMAGTDVEEFELLPHAKLVSNAKKVDGGAVLNGNKCFISGGPTANVHLLIMPYDTDDPINTFAMFLVPTETPGFSVGRIENKMGMKAGSVSELVFKDCFVPENYIIMSGDEFPVNYGEDVVQRVLGLTRITVGAMGTGVARGAFEKALSFAKTNKWKGKTIIQHQWAQEILTNMLMNVYMARSIYLEATYILFNTMGGNDTPDLMGKFMDTALFEKVAKSVYKSAMARKFRYNKKVQSFMLKKFYSTPSEKEQRLQFYASMSKVVGSDMGMKNCHLAVEMMGEYGLRHDAGMEKLFRDNKLCQIFEGTNQLNRLNMFKHYIARDLPDVDVF